MTDPSPPLPPLPPPVPVLQASPEVDPHLLLFLRGRDASCPGCEYNLRDLTTDRCPECGQSLQLSLRLVEPRQAALIAGLVGLAAGAGLGGLLLVYALIMALVGRFGSPTAEFVVINTVGFAAHAVVLWLWVKNWGRIRRAATRTRWWLVVLCWAMPLAFIIVFSFAIN